MNEDGHTSSIRDKILTINVKPGWKSGTRITFPKEGDQGPNNIPGNTLNNYQFIDEFSFTVRNLSKSCCFKQWNFFSSINKL